MAVHMMQTIVPWTPKFPGCSHEAEDCPLEPKDLLLC